MKVHLVLFISTADPVKGPQLRDIDLFTCPPQGLTLSLGREVACELMQDECASFQEGFEHIAQNLVQFPMLYQWMYQLLTGSLFVRVQELIQEKVGRILPLCVAMPVADIAHNEQVDAQYVRGVLDGCLWATRFERERAVSVIRDRRDACMAEANNSRGDDNALRVQARVEAVERARALEGAASEIERGRP